MLTTMEMQMLRSLEQKYLEVVLLAAPSLLFSFAGLPHLHIPPIPLPYNEFLCWWCKIEDWSLGFFYKTHRQWSHISSRHPTSPNLAIQWVSEKQRIGSDGDFKNFYSRSDGDTKCIHKECTIIAFPVFLKILWTACEICLKKMI